MAVWTTPTTRTTGNLVTAAIWNTDIVENLKYLKDSPVFDGDISVGDDLFLTSTGAVINFASGDVTITHSTNTLTWAGASSGYIFNDGNVGIGVTPESLLHIRGSGPILTIDDSGNTTAGISYRPAAASYAERGRLTWDVVNAEMRLAAGASGGSFFQTFYTNGTERMRITSGGNVGIGKTARIYLDGVDGTGNTYIVEGTDDTMSLFVGGVEALFMSTAAFYALKVYDDTTADAANVNVAADGRMRRSTSSIRYKHDIVTLDTTDALSAVMAMRPVTYRGKTDDDQRRFVGFIAEEVQQVAPLLCTYDEGGESGTPNYVTYDRVTAYLVAVVQQQQNKIAALEARIH